MANLRKNFVNEEQITFLVYPPPCSAFDEELFSTELNDASKFFSEMDNNIEFNIQDNNVIKEIPETRMISGNSGLQSYHHQQQDLAEIGIIHIPAYFENNNIYSRDFIQNNQQSLYPQELQNNNMLLQNNSEIPLEPQPPKAILYDQTEWLSPTPCNDMYQQHNIALSHMFGSVLESQFSTPMNSMDTMQTTLPVSTPLISFGDPQNFNYFASRRLHSFPSVPSLYETECQSQITSSGAASSLCSQKPPVYTKWTEEEDELLRAAIRIYGPHKWSLIAAHVPNRTPMQCSTRWLGALNPTIHKGRWTPEEDAALKDAVSEYVDLIDSDGHPQPIPWNKIASRIPHRTGIQCQARWSEALDPSVRKGKWSPEEDKVLKEGVRRYGRCWIRIAELIEGRTQRQCRTRWVQIKNKEAKIERDVISAKAAALATTVSTEVSTDDECNVILTPPRTTPSTPAQTIGHISPVHLLSMNHMTTYPSALKNKSPTLSPTESAAESCVTTPDSSTFESQ